MTGNGHRERRARFFGNGAGRARKSVGILCTFLLLGLGVPHAEASQQSSHLKPVRSVVAPSGARGLCQTNAWACSVTASGGKISATDLATISRVNRSVNRRVRTLSDRTQFRVDERWSLPTRRGGDCEDIALLKKRDLIRMGYPAQSLLIATVLDKRRRGHAVLVVRTESGDVVLDNMTNRIKSWSETGYVFLRMQDPRSPSKWVIVSG